MVGGVNIMATPTGFVDFSRQRGLAPDGRIKAFAAAADGTIWCEAVGVILVERLSEARRKGHHVLAVVRGSAVNQDGASNGLTAPNGPSQQRVIRAALADARLAAAQVDVVEAHGTGTTLGDPIEAQALLATYGKDRPAGRPLWLGSVKSNIGHSGAAAGVTGIMKMVLAMRNSLLPRTLHVDEPTPHVDWSEGAVSLLTEPVPWPAEEDRPRRAGVSAFGVSGTNAHVLLEEPPAENAEPQPADGLRPPVAVPLLLSGRSAGGLRAQAARLAGFVGGRVGVGHVDVAFSSVVGRARFEHRAVVVAGGREGLLEGVGLVARGESGGGVVSGVVSGAGSGPVVFVFPGQGSQWAGMALELAGSSGVFRERLVECGVALEPFVEWSLLEVLGDSVALGRVDVVQPALWAVMVSLAGLWRAHGVVPGAVVGHSQGEIAAVCVAGGLSLEDGARVVALRSRALLELSGLGGMVSVGLGVDAVRERLAAWDGRLSVAVVNGTGSTVVSGDVDALDELLAACEAEGVRARRVPVDYASHSAHVERIEGRLAELLAPVRPRSGDIPLMSTVTGEFIDTAGMGAAYWYTNLRNPVEFERATRVLLEQGHHAFLEMSPHPVLAVPVEETAEHAGVDAVVVGSLRRDEGGLARFYASLGQAYVSGVRVDWEAGFEGSGARRVDLPTYAFQRRRYWLELPEAGDGGGGAADPVEARFWEAVEREDLEALAGTLELGEGSAPLGEILPALSSWRRARKERSTVESWRYRVEWRPVPDSGAAALSGTWLLVAPPGDEHTGTVAGAMRGRGAQVTVVEADPADPAAALAPYLDGQPLSGVVSLLAWAAADDLGAPAAATLAMLRTLADAGVEVPLWAVTRGAVSVDAAEAVDSPAQAAVWGLGQVAALEHPGLWGGLLDLPAQVDDRAADRLAPALAGAGGEDQLAVRPAGLFARRVVRAPYDDAPDDAAWTPAGTVLVTGGAQGPAAHTARWLARNGAEHLILAAPAHDDERSVELAAELASLGARTTFAPCDAADRGELAALLAGIPDDSPLTAVVHTAELLDEGPLQSFSGERLAEVLRAKAGAARNLHELTADRTELTAFVLFSSVAATLGGTLGLGAYAAAGAYLDALAQQRAAAGLPAASVAWGAWADTDTRTEDATAFEQARQDRLARRGMPSLDPDLAVTALRRAAGRDTPVAVVADLRWDTFERVFTASRPSPLTAEIPEVKRLRREAGGPGDGDRPALPPLAGLPEAEQNALLLDLVRAQIAGVLGHADPASVDAERAFLEIGFDSLTTVELRNRLSAAIGRKLPAGAVLEARTPAALARYLRSELVGADGAAAEPAPGSAPVGLISTLFRQARERGTMGEFLGLATAAARLRPRFETAEPGVPAEPVRLAEGGHPGSGADLLPVGARHLRAAPVRPVRRGLRR